MAGMRKKSKPIELDGVVWMTVGGDNLGGKGRIGLLRAIAEHGSITQAAKAIGMSYKAAWDAVDTMNNVAAAPLVERSTGGRGGGSTCLTERGKQLVERFAQIDAIHHKFVQLLSDEAIDLGNDLNLMRTLNMRTSARNQLMGTVTAIRAGAVNDQVELTLPGGGTIVAIVTRESTESLGLRINTTAFALVKSSSIIIATEAHDMRLSARNQLRGTVAAVTPGAVNAEVALNLDGGGSIAATITLDGLKSLGLIAGNRGLAVFKASSVILGVFV